MVTFDSSVATIASASASSPDCVNVESVTVTSASVPPVCSSVEPSAVVVPRTSPETVKVESVRSKSPKTLPESVEFVPASASPAATSINVKSPETVPETFTVEPSAVRDSTVPAMVTFDSSVATIAPASASSPDCVNVEPITVTSASVPPVCSSEDSFVSVVVPSTVPETVKVELSRSKFSETLPESVDTSTSFKVKLPMTSPEITAGPSVTVTSASTVAPSSSV